MFFFELNFQLIFISLFFIILTFLILFFTKNYFSFSSSPLNSSSFLTSSSSTTTIKLLESSLETLPFSQPLNKSLHVIIEPHEKKWLLQSRVANVKNSNDLFLIFDEFNILHSLKLPLKKINLNNNLNQLTEQTFRDLVRDKININNELIKVDDNILSSPELFQIYFLNKIKEVISSHLNNDFEKIDTLALYICCHLSRTRSGGDSFFAVKDLFDSPQVFHYLII